MNCVIYYSICGKIKQNKISTTRVGLLAVRHHTDFVHYYSVFGRPSIIDAGGKFAVTIQ
jgi:hypothetical protein